MSRDDAESASGPSSHRSNSEVAETLKYNVIVVKTTHEATTPKASIVDPSNSEDTEISETLPRTPPSLSTSPNSWEPKYTPDAAIPWRMAPSGRERTMTKSYSASALLTMSMAELDNFFEDEARQALEKKRGPMRQVREKKVRRQLSAWDQKGRVDLRAAPATRFRETSQSLNTWTAGQSRRVPTSDISCTTPGPGAYCTKKTWPMSVLHRDAEFPQLHRRTICKVATGSNITRFEDITKDEVTRGIESSWPVTGFVIGTNPSHLT